METNRLFTIGQHPTSIKRRLAIVMVIIGWIASSADSRTHLPFERVEDSHGSGFWSPPLPPLDSPREEYFDTHLPSYGLFPSSSQTSDFYPLPSVSSLDQDVQSWEWGTGGPASGPYPTGYHRCQFGPCQRGKAGSIRVWKKKVLYPPPSRKETEDDYQPAQEWKKGGEEAFQVDYQYGYGQPHQE